MNEITKITRLLFDRPTLMNFKTQDQKVSPRYGRIKKKKMKRVGDGMEYFARVEKVKITQENGFIF